MVWRWILRNIVKNTPVAGTCILWANKLDGTSCIITATSLSFKDCMLGYRHSNELLLGVSKKTDKLIKRKKPKKKTKKIEQKKKPS
jgi:hypothetical protein